MFYFKGKLPESLINDLSQMAKKHKVPENKIIEKALSLYLEQLSRAE